jgi:hypothetical protein
MPGPDRPCGWAVPLHHYRADRTRLLEHVAASRMAGGPAHIVDLLCLDAGLRLGEATALRWEDCVFFVMLRLSSGFSTP